MPSPRSAELTLSGVAASVPEARRFVRSTLQSWELDGLVEPAVLVVSELATNAVLHARSSYVVRVQVAGDRLRVEVTDASVRRPDRRTHTPEAATGRGLAIVAELARAWGVDPGPDGKTVWAELPLEPDRALRGSGGGGPLRSARGQRRDAGGGPQRHAGRAAA